MIDNRHEGGEPIFTMTPSTHGSDKKKRAMKPRRRFDHLGPEAVAAFVDGEMSRKSAHNARVHLVLCENCRADVHRQRRAAHALRNCNSDEQVQASESLLDRLRSIAAASDSSTADTTTGAKTTGGNSGHNSAGEEPAACQSTEHEYSVHKRTAPKQNGAKQADLIERIEKLARAVRRNHHG